MISDVKNRVPILDTLIELLKGRKNLEDLDPTIEISSLIFAVRVVPIEQNRTEQNGIERNRTERNRTEWNRTERNRTERNRHIRSQQK